MYDEDLDALLADARALIDAPAGGYTQTETPLPSRRASHDTGRSDAPAHRHQQQEEPKPARHAKQQEKEAPKRSSGIMGIKKVSTDAKPQRPQPTKSPAPAAKSKPQKADFDDDWDDSPFVESVEEPVKRRAAAPKPQQKRPAPAAHPTRPAQPLQPAKPSRSRVEPSKAQSSRSEAKDMAWMDEDDDLLDEIELVEDDDEEYEDEPPRKRPNKRPGKRERGVKAERRVRGEGKPKRPQKPAKRPRKEGGEKGSSKGGKKGILIALYAVMIICIIGLCIIVPKIVSTIKEYREARMEYQQVSDNAIIPKAAPTRDDARQVVMSYVDAPTTEEDIEAAIDDYMAAWVPVEVDWDYLYSVNKDVIGWIYCEGTQINYPVTQTDNNYYYLSRTVNKTYSGAGTIFANYQSDLGNRLSHFILYGHHMKDDSMFGILDHYKKVSFYNEHPYMYYLTPDSTYKITIFSGHIVESAAKNFPLLFEDDSEYRAYLDNIASACDWGNASLASTDYQLVTLVTCDYTYTFADPRYIVHGMLEPVGGAAYAAMREAQAAEGAA